MAGPLKTLFGALQASTFLTANSVTLVFGPEEINKQRYPRPYVVMVPTNAPYKDSPGYAAGTDPITEMLWEKDLTVEFWCFNSATGSGVQGAIDHTDAVETLEGWMLSALQDQRAQYVDVNSVAHGLQYKISAGRWEVFGDNPTGPLSRAWVISGRIAVTTAMSAPQEATVTTVQTTVTI